MSVTHQPTYPSPKSPDPSHTTSHACCLPCLHMSNCACLYTLILTLPLLRNLRIIMICAAVTASRVPTSSDMYSVWRLTVLSCRHREQGAQQVTDVGRQQWHEPLSYSHASGAGPGKSQNVHGILYLGTKAPAPATQPHPVQVSTASGRTCRQKPPCAAAHAGAPQSQKRCLLRRVQPQPFELPSANPTRGGQAQWYMHMHRTSL